MRLIDADAFSEQYGNYYAEQGTAEGFIGTVGELIAEAPAVDAEPVRHGRWMFLEQKNGYLWKCSNCKGNFDQQFSYCPHCGARMGGGDAE